MINKGNDAKAPYAPNLIFRLINMTMVNAYRIYKALVTTRMPDRHCLTMREAIKELIFFADAARYPDAKEGGVASNSDSRLFVNSWMEEWQVGDVR